MQTYSDSGVRTLSYIWSFCVYGLLWMWVYTRFHYKSMQDPWALRWIGIFKLDHQIEAVVKTSFDHLGLRWCPSSHNSTYSSSNPDLFYFLLQWPFLKAIFKSTFSPWLLTWYENLILLLSFHWFFCICFMHFLWNIFILLDISHFNNDGCF